MPAERGEPDGPADDPCYSVGQVAKLLQVPHAFLRRLDSEEVVIPARSDGGHRRYTRRQVVQLRQVQELVAEGLTLAGIRRVFQLEARIAELEEILRRQGRRSTGRASGSKPK